MRSRVNEDFLIQRSLNLVWLGMFTLPMESFRAGSNLTLSDVFFIGAAGLCLLSAKKRQLPRISGWFFGSFLMLIGGITSTYEALLPTSSLLVVAEEVYVFFIWTWLLRSVLTSPGRLVRAIEAYCIGTTISAFVAIVHHGSGGSSDRAVGLTGQPNIAGVTFALAVVLIAGMILHDGYGKWCYRPAAVAVLAIALILSASVSGMGCALVGIFIVLIRRGMKIRTLFTVGIALVVLYVAGVSVQGASNGKGENLNPFARISETTTTGSGYDTVGVRDATLTAAWAGIQASPIFGHGLDQTSAAIYYDPQLGVYYTTHNFVLLVWYEGGLFFLVGATVAIVASFRRLLGRRSRSWHRDVVLGGAVTVLLFAMQGPELVDRWFWLPFILGLTFRRGNQAMLEGDVTEAAADLSAGALPQSSSE